MPVTRDILEAQTKPRRVMARLLDMGQREDRVLAMLMGACVLFFVMQWPSLAREAHITGQEFSQMIAYAFFGAVIVLPLVFYALAGVLHLVARALGGAGTWYTARLALFWSLLATTPIALLWGLMKGLNDNASGAQLIGWIGTALFLWIFINSMLVAERR